MMNNNIGVTGPVACCRGFSIMELLITILVLSVLSVIAVPPVVQWAKGAEHRKTARHITYLLREARSRAIATNTEHRVEFDKSHKKYRVAKGDASSGSSQWEAVTSDWHVAPDGIRIESNIGSVHWNPNGTANAGTIKIQDEHTQESHYEVRVARTGRVRIPTLF